MVHHRIQFGFIWLVCLCVFGLAYQLAGVWFWLCCFSFSLSLSLPCLMLWSSLIKHIATITTLITIYLVFCLLCYHIFCCCCLFWFCTVCLCVVILYTHIHTNIRIHTYTNRQQTLIWYDPVVYHTHTQIHIIYWPRRPRPPMPQQCFSIHQLLLLSLFLCPLPPRTI